MTWLVSTVLQQTGQIGSVILSTMGKALVVVLTFQATIPGSKVAFVIHKKPLETFVLITQ